MSVSKEELLHIAELADLKIEENEIDEYLKNLDDILNYTEVIQNAPIENVNEPIGENDASNVFRKDEVNEFENIDGMLSNAKDLERNMIKVPKVIQ